MNRRNFLKLKNNKENSNFKLNSKTPSLVQYNGEWNETVALHLLRRTVIGPTVSEINSVVNMGLVEAVNKLTTAETTLPPPSRFVGTWLDANILYLDPGTSNASVFIEEMRRWWIGLMINNGLSVRERMVLFWHNHFASDYLTSYTDARFFYNQNQLFRRNSVGNFKQMCVDITTDKAMLIFLNGRNNKKNTLQENYSRELQELFTIGLNDNNGNPNYTQNEQNPGATVENNLLTGHDNTDKNFYNKIIKGDNLGSVELNSLINLIFEKEETSKYLIRKLYRYFVYTDVSLTPVTPIPEVIEENIITPLSKVFRDSNWDVGKVLNVLFKSEHFYDESIKGSMIKNPAELFVSVIRPMKSGEIKDEFLLHFFQQECTALGMNLFAPPGVQGWQFHRFWISTTTLPRRRTATDSIINGKNLFYTYVLNPIFQGVEYKSGSAIFNVMPFINSLSGKNDPDLLVKQIANHLLAYSPNDKTFKQIKDSLLQGQPDYEWQNISDKIKEERIKSMMKFIMRLPHFQLTQ